MLRSSHISEIRIRQHSCKKGKYVLGPPSSNTFGINVFPRVSTVRFCITIASAKEFIISLEGTEVLTRFTMSVSAKTPHLAATWWSLSV